MFRKKFIRKLEKNLNKVKGLISIARKGGYVIIGKDNLEKYTQKLYLLLVDKSAGNSLVREMKILSQRRDIPSLLVEDLQFLVGIGNCKVIGLKNKAISENIEKCLKGEEFGNTTT